MEDIYINLLIVFFLTGLWHGASWVFVLWGLYNAFFIILERIFKTDKPQNSKIINLIKHLYVTSFFVIGWVIFRSENIFGAAAYIKKMFSFLGANSSVVASDYIERQDVLMLGIAFICALPLFQNILQWKKKNLFFELCVDIWLLFLLILSASFIAITTYNPFIFFRF